MGKGFQERCDRARNQLKDSIVRDEGNESKVEDVHV